MRISEIMDLVIDPRPEMQAKALKALVANKSLYSRCCTFVLYCEGYGGYDVDEIRLKWETRIVRTLREALARYYGTRVRCKVVKEGYALTLDGDTLAGPYPSVKAYITGVRRVLNATVKALPSEELGFVCKSNISL